MEITHLLDKLKKTPKESLEYFFAIQIDTEFVKTAIWTVQHGTADITAVGEITEWDGTSNEILLEAIDNSLSTALEKLPPGIQEPQKAIFGLQESWVSQEGIMATRLSDLKEICEKLSLKPLGFVVTTEAITHYLKAKEGTPLTGILLRVSTSEVTVSVVSLGEIEGTHVAGRSGDLAADVHEGLARFGERETFPSRMILYNGNEDLSELTQQLLAYDWQEKLPFLHIPKIEAVGNSFSISAIAVAGGAEVAKSLGFVIEAVKPEPESRPLPEMLSLDLDVVDQHVPPPLPSELSKPEIQLTNKIQDEISSNDNAPLEENAKETTSEEQTQIQFPKESSVDRVMKFPNGILPHIGTSIRSFMSNIHLPKLSMPKGFSLTVLFVGGILLILALGVVFAAHRIPRVTVNVVFSTQRLNDSVAITVDPSASVVNPHTHILPAEKVTISKTKDGSKETTGKKTTGEKTNGEITISNKTNAVKKFLVGTTVIGPNGKEFTIDTDVSVASQSAQPTSSGVNITYGTATVRVTASDVGQEYNLEPASEFKISNLSPSAFSGKNDIAFAGGSKKEIQAVSKKDQTELKESLLSLIKQEAATEIEASPNGKKVFPETVSAIPTKEEFDHSVGSEATEEKLTLTAQVTILAVKEGDYYDLLASVLSEKIPDGFTLKSERMETSIENVRIEEERVFFDTTVSAVLSPKVTPDEIAIQIAGKRPKEAVDFIKTLPYFKRMELIFSPSIPPILQWIPNDSSHTTVSIVLEE